MSGTNNRPKADQPATEALLRDALDAINEAFVIYGPDGRLVLCNENFRRIYGYTEEEARPGVHFQELGRIDVERGNVVVSDEFGNGEAYLEHKAEYRRKLEGSFVVQLKDGRWLKTTDRPTLDGGFVSVQADVTELKEAEADMAAARTAAEHSSRAKSEFLAKMSHELRTPLNSILGFSDLLASDDTTTADIARIQSYARSIHHSGLLLLELINDILDLSKIEAGKLELDEGAVDVADVVHGCIEMVRPRAESAELSIVFTPAPDLPRLFADERSVKQVLLNLLTNAVKFSDPGKTVTIEAGTAPQGGLRIAVIDHGVGIAAQHIARILQPFEQVSASYSRNPEGAGLGLSIARALMEAHGGRIEIESEQDRGTTVAVTFPAERIAGAD